MDKTQDNSPDAAPARQDRASRKAQRQRLLMLLTLMLVVVVLAGGSLLIFRRSLGGRFADELVIVPAPDMKAGQEGSADDVVPVSLGESCIPSGDIVEIDENELEPMPDGRFLGPERTAEGGRFDSDQAPDPTILPAPVARPGSATQPALSNLARDSLAAAGLSSITGDIPDAVVPPGAQRLYAFRQVAADRAADTCAYLIPMSLSAAEKFYKTQLAGKGYNLIVNKDAARPAGRIMTFAKDRRQYYYVNLHPTDKDNEVKAVLVIARPQPQAGN